MDDTQTELDARLAAARLKYREVLRQHDESMENVKSLGPGNPDATVILKIANHTLARAARDYTEALTAFTDYAIRHE